MIGVFDSGVGGLTVVQHIQQLLPQADIVYLADVKYAPYGDRSNEWLSHRSAQIAHYLVENGALSLVIACNTATAAAVENIRNEFAVEIVGVEPGIKPALQASKNGKVAILATPSTVRSQRFESLCQRYSDSSHEVFSIACPQWAFAAEYEMDNKARVESLVKDTLSPVIAQGVDVVVLGCTHYARFIPEITRQFDGLTIIETGLAVAKRVQSVAPLAAGAHQGQLHLLSTDKSEHLHAFAKQLGLNPSTCEQISLAFNK